MDNIIKQKDIIVSLVHHTPLSVMASAGRQCWESYHRGGCYSVHTDHLQEEDREFLDRILNKNKHESVAEHVVYNFSIQGITRACLQEVARHRHASLSVKSTRYTLGKDFKEHTFFKKDQDNKYYNIDYDLISKYFVINRYDYEAMEILCRTIEYIQSQLEAGVSYDKVKYHLPECYKTSLYWSINCRALRNFLTLRTSKAALAEIRELAYSIFTALPDQHKFLYNLSEDNL